MKTSAIVEFGFENFVPEPYRRDHNPFEKRLDRKPWQRLNLMNLSPNPIGVINRRNGCYTAATLPKSTIEIEITSQLIENSRFSVLPKQNSGDSVCLGRRSEQNRHVPQSGIYAINKNK